MGDEVEHGTEERVSATPWPDHLLSLDEWDALPEDNTHRYELAEGVMQVSPRPTSNHQWAQSRLFRQLDAQLPNTLAALPDVEVALLGASLASVRVPDLVVVPTLTAQGNPRRYTSDDVLLAVEIVSPGSRRTDTVTKLSEYADAGIKHYWIVDLDEPASITAYLLVDGDFELVGEATEKLVLDEPTPVTIDIPSLLP